MKAFLVIAAFMLAALDVRAQAPSSEAAPKKNPKAESKARPSAAAKPAPKAAAKPAAKPAAKTASPSKVQATKNVTVYTNTPPPAIKDKDGRVIPATPDAYDVSSALPKKK
jgi:hypothetical protein